MSRPLQIHVNSYTFPILSQLIIPKSAPKQTHTQASLSTSMKALTAAAAAPAVCEERPCFAPHSSSHLRAYVCTHLYVCACMCIRKCVYVCLHSVYVARISVALEQVD